MTQLAISEDLARTINAVAADRNCSSEELLREMFETDEEFGRRMLTSSVGERILGDLGRDRRDFETSEDVDRRFAALYLDLESK